MLHSFSICGCAAQTLQTWFERTATGSDALHEDAAKESRETKVRFVHFIPTAGEFYTERLKIQELNHNMFPCDRAKHAGINTVNNTVDYKVMVLFDELLLKRIYRKRPLYEGSTEELNYTSQRSCLISMYVFISHLYALPVYNNGSILPLIIFLNYTSVKKSFQVLFLKPLYPRAWSPL